MMTFMKEGMTLRRSFLFLFPFYYYMFSQFRIGHGMATCTSWKTHVGCCIRKQYRGLGACWLDFALVIALVSAVIVRIEVML